MSVEPSIYEKYCDYFTYANESYESRIHRLFGNGLPVHSTSEFIKTWLHLLSKCLRKSTNPKKDFLFMT